MCSGKHQKLQQKIIIEDELEAQNKELIRKKMKMIYMAK